MKKKIAVFTVVIILLVPLMSFMAFAASDDGGTLWNVIDAMWDFTRDIINNVAKGFNNVVSTLGDMIRAIRGFFSDLIRAIGNAVNALFSGLKQLFIPAPDYFFRTQSKIQDALHGKFGNFLYLSSYLKTEFSKLSSYKKIDGMFVMKFPKEHVLNGAKFDLFYYGKYYAPYIRLALTGLVTLATVAFCYRRILSMINT